MFRHSAQQIQGELQWVVLGRSERSVRVGDLQRIKLYPEKGFQIPQEIPGEIWAAYEELVRVGYDKYLVPL